MQRPRLTHLIFCNILIVAALGIAADPIGNSAGSSGTWVRTSLNVLFDPELDPMGPGEMALWAGLAPEFLTRALAAPAVPFGAPTVLDGLQDGGVLDVEIGILNFNNHSVSVAIGLFGDHGKAVEKSIIVLAPRQMAHLTDPFSARGHGTVTNGALLVRVETEGAKVTAYSATTNGTATGSQYQFAESSDATRTLTKRLLPGLPQKVLETYCSATALCPPTLIITETDFDGGPTVVCPPAAGLDHDIINKCIGKLKEMMVQSDADRGTVLLLPQLYDIRESVWITHDGIRLTTQQEPGEGVEKAIIRADPAMEQAMLWAKNESGALIKNLMIDRIIFDGNKENRWEGYLGRCTEEEKKDFTNLRIVNCENCRLFEIESNNVLCGTALKIHGSKIAITDSDIYEAGFGCGSDQHLDPPCSGSCLPWADGMTITKCDSCLIAGNTVKNATDIGIVLGGGTCNSIDDNKYEQTSGHGFAGIGVGRFDAGDGGQGCHTESTFTNNKIYGHGTGLEFGLHVAKHRWDPDVETYFATVIGNTISGAVVNLAVDGHVGGTILDNNLSSSGGNFASDCFKCSNTEVPIPTDYSVAHATDCCLQPGWQAIQFHHGGGCALADPSDNLCQGGVRFVKENIPPRMQVSEELPVTVKIQNSGQTPWLNDGLYWLELVTDPGPEWGIPEQVSVQEPVAIGDNVTLSFNLRAPGRSQAAEQIEWQMMHDGVPFGQKLSQSIETVNAFELLNGGFNPSLPTVVLFTGGDCVTGGGREWLDEDGDWTSAANVIVSPRYYPDTYATAPSYTYQNQGDHLFNFLLGAAPNYDQPIQTLGFSTGGQVAIDAAARINTHYRDLRFAVNRVTLLDGACQQHDYAGAIARFTNNPVGGEPAWVENVHTEDAWVPGDGDPNDEFGEFRDGTVNVLVPGTHSKNVILHFLKTLYPDTFLGGDVFRNGRTYGAFTSVVEHGSSYFINNNPLSPYSFHWVHDYNPLDPSGEWYSYGHFEHENVGTHPGRLPEPTVLNGPLNNTQVASNSGTTVSCEPSENATRYVLLWGEGENATLEEVATFNTTPTVPTGALPPDSTFSWTFRAVDAYESYFQPIVRSFTTPVGLSGDFDGDGNLAQGDCSIMQAAFGTTWGDAGFVRAADLDNNGTVNWSDYPLWLSLFHQQHPGAPDPCGLPQDDPEIADTFSNVLAGLSISGRWSEVGGGIWHAHNTLVGTGNGTITSNGAATIGSMAVLASSEPLRVEATVDPTAADWVGVGLSSASTSAFWATGQLWVLQRPSGFYRVFANGTAISLAAGTLDPSFPVRVAVEYDPGQQTASAWIGDTQVLAATPIGTTITPIYAGLHINNGTVNTTLVDDFAVFGAISNATVPTGPQLLAPANGATTSSTPALNWSAVDATPPVFEYVVTIQYASNGQLAHSVNVPAPQISYQVPADTLDDGTGYTWRIGATNVVDTGWSSARSFTTEYAQQCPDPPTPTAPVDGAWVDETPTLVWTPGVSVPPISQYQLQVRLAASPATVVYETLIPANPVPPFYHFVPSGSLIDQTAYMWRVRADNGCWGPWSAESSITVKTWIKVDLGSSDIEDGLARTQPEPQDGVTIPQQVTNVCNNNTFKLRKNRGEATTPTSQYLYFSVDDRFINNGSHSDIEIFVSFWKNSPSNYSPLFCLQYDSGDSGSSSDARDPGGHPYTNAGCITVPHDQCMGSATFTIDDAYFGNRQNGGGDFRIWAGTGDTRRFVNVVKVTKN